MMEHKQNWIGNYAEVQDVMKNTGKPGLLFFHSVHCSGCKAMIEKTLPDKDVLDHTGKRFAMGMFEISDPKSKDIVNKYGIEWTPTFIITDNAGNEAYRFVGYLPPRDYRAQLTLGEGKVAMKKEDFDKAARCFDLVNARYPESEAAPEAAYYSGVARYKKTQDAKELKASYTLMSNKYPKSEWTKKASAWSGL